jgi:hypothetical protein
MRRVEALSAAANRAQREAGAVEQLEDLGRLLQVLGMSSWNGSSP